MKKKLQYCFSRLPQSNSIQDFFKNRFLTQTIDSRAISKITRNEDNNKPD